MADIKQIQVDGVTHDIKDEIARTNIGSLSSLNTTNKTSLVTAINEIYNNVDNLICDNNDFKITLSTKEVKTINDLVAFVHKKNLAIYGNSFVYNSIDDVAYKIIRFNASVLKPNTEYVISFSQEALVNPIEITGISNLFVPVNLPTTINANNSFILKTMDTIDFGDWDTYIQDLIWFPWEGSKAINDLMITEKTNDTDNTYEPYDGYIISIPDVNLKSSYAGADYIYRDNNNSLWKKQNIIGENGGILRNKTTTTLLQHQQDLLTRLAFILNRDLSGYKVDLLDSNGIDIFNIFKYDDPDICEVDFLHTESGSIKDVKGNLFEIKAMNESNILYSGDDHASDMYTSRDCAAMGFNTMQFHIYGEELLLTDGETFREDFWVDLQNRINSAKDIGMRIILKFYGVKTSYMTEEGYPSGALWDTEAPSLFLLKSLKKIVDYYQNDPYIIGYSIANEPTNNGLTPSNETEIGYYISYIQSAIAYIRANAPNQLIFVEREEGVDFTTPNIVFEWHMYEPHAFTHQDRANGIFYPDILRSFYQGSIDATNETHYLSESVVTADATIENIDSTWYEVGEYFHEITMDWLMTFNLNVENATSDTVVNFSYITITCYDENKNITRTIRQDWEDNGGIAQNTGSCFAIVDGAGEENAKGLQFSGATTEDRYICRLPSGLSSFKNVFAIAPMEGEVYMSVKCNVLIQNGKIESSPTTAYIDMVSTKYDQTGVFDKDYLCRTIERIETKYNDLNVPIYIGETGTKQNGTAGTMRTLSPDNQTLGGEQYITDLIDIYLTKKTNFAFFVYNHSGFGLMATSTMSNVRNGSYLYSTMWTALSKAMRRKN